MELREYSAQERADIAQQLGVEDSSPAALAKALRHEQVGDVRYSLGEVVPNPVSEPDAMRAVMGVFNGRLPQNVRFVNDQNLRSAKTGLPYKGYQQGNEIVLNLAALKDKADVAATVQEEALHLAYLEPEVQAAVGMIEKAVTPAMLRRMAYMGYDPAIQTEEAAIRLIQNLTSNPDTRSAWRRFIDAIKSAFRRLFRMEPSKQQLEDAARQVLAFALSDRPGFRSEGVRYAGDPKDADYLAAVERGDTVEAQRLVDEAAKAAGYQVGPVWHSTDAEFNTFENTRDIGFHFGTQEQASYKKKARQIRAFLRLQNPIRLEDHSWDEARAIQEALATKSIKSDRLDRLAKEFDNEEKRTSWRSPEAKAISQSAFGEARNLLLANGFDGVVYANSVEGEGDSYIALTPEQIKSAEPVVYDDRGEVIPLSQRFNSSRPDIRYSATEPEGPREQVFGEENVGAVKPERSIASSQALAKQHHFDSSQPISEDATTDAFLKALEWSDPQRGAAMARELVNLAGGDDLVPGVAQGEIAKYARRLVAEQNDTSLINYIHAHAGRWALTKEGTTRSSVGAALRGAKEGSYPQSAVMNAVEAVAEDKEKAETKNIPKEALDEITDAVDKTKLEEKEIATVKKRVKDAKGETLQEKVEKKLADKQAEAIVNRYARTQSDTPAWSPPVQNEVQKAVSAQLRERATDEAFQQKLEALGVNPETARVLTSVVRREIQNIDANAAAKPPAPKKTTAEQILDKLAKEQSGTGPMPKALPDPVRKAVNDALDPRQPGVGLKAKLLALGVEESMADRLDKAVTEQRRQNAEAEVAQQARDLALALRGSLKPLEEMLANTPAPQQLNADWRKRAASTYFQQLGLSEAQAAAAARLYDNEFSKLLQDALESAIEKVARTSAPWKEQQKKVGEVKRKAMNTDLEKLRKAVRLAVVNPDVDWHGELARENGWKGFTNPQVRRLNEIDGLLADETVPDYRKKALITEVQDIVGRAKLPPTVANIIVSSYTMSALSGLPTAFVQFSGPVAIARDFLTDFPTNPIVASRALVGAMDSFVSELVYSAKTNVFNHQVGEHLRDSTPALRSLLESGQKDWQSSNPLTKARGVAKIIIGAQEYMGRLYSAIDQGAIAAAEVYRTSLFSARTLRELGWSREDAGNVVLASFDARRAAYDRLVASGVPRAEAVVAANEEFRNAVYGKLKEVDEEAAKDVATGVGNEILGPVGRLSHNVSNMEEGMLSTPVNAMLDMLSSLYRKGGWHALLARMMFGFVSIPFRSARWFSAYSPYGFVRYAVNKWRTARGLETLWKQSFATRAQEHQRLRDAIVGTTLMAAIAAIAKRSGDDDPDKNELAFIVTGSGPSDPVVRKVWQERFQPYSFYVKVGKTYVAMNLGRAFESVAWPLALTGAMDDVNLSHKGKKARNPDRKLNDAAALLGSYVGSLSQRAAFQSLGALGQSSKRGEDLAKEMSNQAIFTASALLPWKGAMASLTRLASDPVDKSTIEGTIYANLPIIGPVLGRPGLNVLGDPLGDNTFSGKLYREGLPIVARFPTGDESRKVYDLILEKGIAPTAVRRNELEKVYGTVTDDEFYRYQKERGQLIKAAMLAKADKLKAMDVERYRAAVNDITAAANPKAARAVGLKRSGR